MQSSPRYFHVMEVNYYWSQVWLAEKNWDDSLQPINTVRKRTHKCLLKIAYRSYLDEDFLKAEADSVIFKY